MENRITWCWGDHTVRLFALEVMNGNVKLEEIIRKALQAQDSLQLFESNHLRSEQIKRHVRQNEKRKCCVKNCLRLADCLIASSSSHVRHFSEWPTKPDAATRSINRQKAHTCSTEIKGNSARRNGMLCSCVVCHASTFARLCRQPFVFLSQRIAITTYFSFVYIFIHESHQESQSPSQSLLPLALIFYLSMQMNAKYRQWTGNAFFSFRSLLGS